MKKLTKTIKCKGESLERVRKSAGCGNGGFGKVSKSGKKRGLGLKKFMATFMAVVAMFFGQMSLAVVAAPGASAATKTYKVLSVVDGDTIRVQYNGKATYVRLIGVDAPELSSKATTKTGCYATQAKNYLSRRLSGKYVSLVSDRLSGDKDYYGRLLRYVYLGNEEIDRTLVSNGYAREYKFWANNYGRRSSYLSAQTSAKNARRGLWNLNVCSMNR